MVLSVTHATGNTSTNFEVSTTHCPGLIALDVRLTDGPKDYSITRPIIGTAVKYLSSVETPNQ